MSTTTIDLKIGLNLEIGSVPVSLDAEVNTANNQTVYTFDGCMQTAEINIGDFISYVGQQFGVDVQLPPELDLEADIDYIAGQVISTVPASQNGNAQAAKKTTEMGASAKFDLIYSNGGSTKTFTFTFYADTILTQGEQSSAYVVGGSVDTNLPFSKLPLVGNVPVFKDYSLQKLGFSYTNVDPSAEGKDKVTFNIPKVSASENPLYTRSSDTAKNKKDYSIDTSGNKTTFSLAKKGFSFTAGLMKGSSDSESGTLGDSNSDETVSNFALPMSLPTATPTEGPANYYDSGKAVNTSPPASPIHWIKINKTFGPINLQQVGVNYKNGEATFGFSAGFSLGGFSLELQGLSITFPLPLPNMPAGNTVSFDLEGMGMEFKKGNLTIGGAFLKVIQDEITNYYGEVIVQVGNFGLKALGGYAPAQNGQPASFFLYANLEAPLGGPPFLYVSGLAFGFGINRTLILPNIDTLPGYLLLPNNAPAEGSSPSDTISKVMPQMAAIFQDKPGEYWVAAGIQFTSFDMISAFGLVTVSFGVDLQIGLLGACAITLPKGAPEPVAYIEVDLIASFTPSTGLLSVEGVITPASYILSNIVKISGGFAFYIWFSGTHKGDFVVTLGGYNSAYNKPDWYPTVPRITLGYAIGPFQASGSAYLALTPSMFMAGIRFDATFKAGPVKAWFTAGVDFLIGWAPFLYEADAYVNIGCSVDLGLFTLKINIGADVIIWGPPFGGKAHVDLDVVSFTIGFGSSAPVSTPVSWANIEDNFLPKTGNDAVPAPKTMRMARMMAPSTAPAPLKADPEPTANVTASVAVGLLKKDYDGYDWIVDPNKFEIITATTIPANQAKWATGSDDAFDIPNDPSDYGTSPVDVSKHPYLELATGTETYSKSEVWNPNINVKPMKLTDVQSIHTITLLKADSNGNFNDYLNTVAIEPVLGASNTALWGDPNAADDANTPELLPATLLGFSLIPLPRNPDTVNNVPLIQLLFTQGNILNFTFTKQQPDTRYTVESEIDPTDFDLKIEMTGAAAQSFTDQDYILSTLIDDWVSDQRTSILDDLTANGFSTLAPAAVNLKAMGTTETLTDWPLVGILGASLEN